VTAERNGRSLLAKQGEYSGEKVLLLRGVLEATELQGVRQERLNEEAGSTGMLIGIFFCGGKRQIYLCNAMKGILLLWGAKGFSTEQLN
jgi:hypothetical protein